MSTYQTTYVERIGQEIRQTPEEYLPMLLEIVRVFRQSISLNTAEDSFRLGWQEAMHGETIAVPELWVGIDAQ